ncbi:mitochondrial import inner membrane translocase subunit TIM50-A-like isoform X2 [Halichondria panicea]|uniref:mitochondrial import inner membrane translocase subunit TIM50-A-like isoform X2 n=1 Tax=Halichondria panicea TaxID=6063 RepID=UPI00312B7C54
MATLGQLKRLHLLKTGAQRAAQYYVKPKESRGPSGQGWLALAGVSTALLGTGIYLLGRPEEEIEGLGPQEPDEYANVPLVKAYLYRAWDTVVNFKKSFSEPSSDKLLPDYLPHPYQRPYTLVLEMNDLLLHTSYDRLSGWKYQKRPGVDALLLQLFEFYEIVVFTSETAINGNSLLTALDPNQLILYKLYRNSTKYVDGVHVKDLTNLNRPLNRVIIVDTNSKSVKFHKDNSIIMEKWTGDVDDKTLWELIPLLQTIAVNEVDDVRHVLNFYKAQRGEDKVLETYRLNQALLQAEEEQRREQMEQLARQGARRGVGGPISTFSLSRKQQIQNPESVTPPTTIEAPPTDPLANQDQSWNDWIASWVGWK